MVSRSSPVSVLAQHADRGSARPADIINVSKLNLGLLSIELAPCNLEGVLHDVLKSFDPIARNQHVELSFSRDPSLDRLGVEVVVADAGRIRQLAWNFVSAAKFSMRDLPFRLRLTFADLECPEVRGQILVQGGQRSSRGNGYGSLAIAFFSTHRCSGTILRSAARLHLVSGQHRRLGTRSEP